LKYSKTAPYGALFVSEERANINLNLERKEDAVNKHPEERIENEHLEKVIRFLKEEAGLSEETISAVRAELLTYGPEELCEYHEVLRLTSLALENVRNSYNHKVGHRRPTHSSRLGLTFSCDRQIVLPASTR
jgi:hypothetical protein